MSGYVVLTLDEVVVLIEHYETVLATFTGTSDRRDWLEVRLVELREEEASYLETPSGERLVVESMPQSRVLARK